MSKPRQFWIVKEVVDDDEPTYRHSFTVKPKYEDNELTHVIEYSAYQNLIDQNEQLIKALRYYSNEVNWYENIIEHTDVDYPQGEDEQSKGGKRARQILKNLGAVNE